MTTDDLFFLHSFLVLHREDRPGFHGCERAFAELDRKSAVRLARFVGREAKELASLALYLEYRLAGAEHAEALRLTVTISSFATDTSEKTP